MQKLLKKRKRTESGKLIFISQKYMAEIRFPNRKKK